MNRKIDRWVEKSFTWVFTEELMHINEVGIIRIRAYALDGLRPSQF